MKLGIAPVLLATTLLAVGCETGPATETPAGTSPANHTGLITPTPSPSIGFESEEKPTQSSPWGNSPEPDDDGAYKFVVGGKVTQPIVIEKGPYDHERFAGRRVRGGSIVAEMVIEVDGTVGDIKLLNGVDPEMDQEFLRSLEEYLFEPAMLEGEPVPVRYIMVMRIHVQ